MTHAQGAVGAFAKKNGIDNKKKGGEYYVTSYIDFRFRIREALSKHVEINIECHRLLERPAPSQLRFGLSVLLLNDWINN